MEAGPDRGVDIFASPDGLGLQEPRIFVEVKHRSGTQVNAEKIRAFLGGREAADKCLYLSTGSFTKGARYEAERASVPITLLDLQDLRKLLVDDYGRLDWERRALVPLKRFYWPLVQMQVMAGTAADAPRHPTGSMKTLKDRALRWPSSKGGYLLRA